jgi:hypothetical protein
MLGNIIQTRPLLTFAKNRLVCLIDAFNFDTPGTPDPSLLSYGSGFPAPGVVDGPALAFFR